MRSDLPPPNVADGLLSRRAVTVTLYRGGTPLDLVLGAGVDPFDLSPFVERVSQGPDSATITVRHAGELSGDDRPAAGNLVSVAIDAGVVWNGIVETISGETETRGERSLSIVARTRDAFPIWRDVRRISELFGVGADLGEIARSVAYQVGLTDAEITLPNLGISLVHDTAQMADLSAWDMLELALQPALAEPFVDAVGRVKAISREVRGRAPDLEVPWTSLASVSSSGSRPSLTAVRVTWLDPNLTIVFQEAQPLATATLACGFFSPNPRREVSWSRDQLQRASNVYMEIEQSINESAGLFGLRVGDEWFRPVDEYHGTVGADLGAALPVVTTVALASFITLSAIPDAVNLTALSTIPVGRMAQQLSLNVFLQGLMTQGVGSYRLVGTPYDYVHAENQTEAFDASAPDYLESVEELRNDFVPDESRAQGLAVAELIYRSRAAARGSVSIVDDLRLERGDLLGLPDGRRFYVTGYTRDLRRGAEGLLDVEGFFV